MTKKVPRVVSSIICDDIRQESGNKVSLMGIYNYTVLVQELPKTFLKFSLHQRWEDLPQKGLISFALKGPSLNAPKISLTFEKRLDETTSKSVDTVDFSISFTNIVFSQEGEYRFISFFEDERNPESETKFLVRRVSSLPGVF